MFDEEPLEPDSSLPHRTVPAWAVSAVVHVICLAVLIGSGGDPVRQGGSAPALHPKLEMFIAPPPEDPDLRGLNARDSQPITSEIPTLSSADISIPGGFRFNAEKIADSARLLFPFLTPGISLHQFALKPPTREHALTNPFSQVVKAAGQSSMPPLVMSNAALDALVDESWSRRDRWTPFQRIVLLTRTHSADDGALPALLRAYVDRDGQQPYFQTTVADPRLWTLLGLAADDVKFVGFISQYTSEHPGTRASTELLFLLDDMALGSVGVLTTLLNTDPQADLQWTRTSNPRAYKLIAALKLYYQAELRKKGLMSPEALRAYYDRVRLAILNGILQTTPMGYRANDARFIIGTIYWRSGRVDEALAAWGEMTVDPSSRYATVSSDILAALRGYSPADATVKLARHINAALDLEHGRWLTFSYERLAKFGYKFDTF
ncbi:MAG TPA: hypothetical protein VGJ29_00965 [Vicinamibacterales bacterium]|jgi:hypothetical protein